MNQEVPNNPLPCKSWEIFAYARRILGESGLYKVFHIEKTQIYRWARSPEVEESRRNPIDRVSNLLAEISVYGGDEGREVAKIALSIMAQDCGCKIVDVYPVQPSTDNPRSEFMQIFTALNDLQKAAERHDDPFVVQSYESRAHDALDGFMVRYTSDFREQGGKVRFSKSQDRFELSKWRRFKLWLLG